ncbi:hypothetical protein CUMW_263740 [Citrus unshiu]|uniref:NADP-dependent oxidoreductase domain-containing protein n=1 Tax=Citrus unshiu TaxID=55188 RepID=A0A2H5QUZ5_CITUN|nr:hypothetical protein CUMW_263740 [Citrus unshiu]
MHGHVLKPESDMIALIHHAIDSGITVLDTSDVYGPHTNEILLGKALKARYRGRVELATEFGIRYEDGQYSYCGDPAYVRAACDCIDLYYQHRIDTKVPIEVTIGELKKLVEEGKIKYIGLSEASASTIRRARHPSNNSCAVGMVLVVTRCGGRDCSYLQIPMPSMGKSIEQVQGEFISCETFV